MTCSSCKYLKENDKKNGSVSGSKYYCSKLKSYIDATNSGCDSYDKDYMRNNYTCDTIYEDSNKFYDDDRPLSYHVFILILTIGLGILVSVFNNIGGVM